MTKRTIAVLTDSHYGEVSVAERRGDIADILLQRAVHRLNDQVHPDVTVVLGDMASVDSAADGERLKRVAKCLRDLEGPVIVLPGNHDGPVEDFYRVFERPPDVCDVAGIRFLPFLDRDEPGYQASRPPEALDRFRLAREGFAGPIVALQHVPVVPPGSDVSPYNHLDAGAIIDAMTTADVALSLSGHLHTGHAPVTAGPTCLVTAPALCEAPFPFLVVRLGPAGVEVERRELMTPPALRLVEYHAHTQFAYCGEDSDMTRGIALARDFGLAGIGFAEHSGQLYFSREDYWSGLCHAEGVAAIKPADSRIDAYFEAAAAHRGPGVAVGLEVDADHRGQPVLCPEDRERADHLIGAVHRLPALDAGDAAPGVVLAEFFAQTEALLRHRLDMLAHPLRFLNRGGVVVTRDVMARLVELLKASGTAAEVNFHLGGPPAEFVRMCVERGVKLSLGGDAHTLFDIGNFSQHLELLRAAGVTESDLPDVLYQGVLG